MQWTSPAIITSFVALCFAQSPSLECERNITVSRNTASQIVRSEVINVANRIFFSGLPSEASDKELYRALISGYSEMESDMGLTVFQTAQMEITEQYFLACSGPEEQRPLVGDIGFHILQFVAILGTSPRDISALRKQFGILTCLQQQMSYSNPNCSAVDCSGGLENTTSASTFLCCLEASHVRELFGIISQVATFNSIPCLAFVVDTTGSMSAEIDRVRTLVHGFVNPADPVCYILVDFNDVGKVAADSVFLRAVFDPSGALAGGTINEFVTAVNSLTTHGGDDCPEFGMIGLLLALDQLKKLHPIAASLSQIILLTDASAINDYLYTDVISNATALGVIVHELLIRGGCSGTGFGNYPRIANATGGIQVDNLDDFDIITNFVQRTLVSGGFEGNSIFGPALPSHIVQVPEFTTVLGVLIRTIQPHVTIITPNGTVILTVSRNLAFYGNENPSPGNYTFSVAFGTLEIAADVPVLLDLFVSYIMDDPGSGGSLPVHEPLACSQGRVSASTSRLSDIDLTHPVYLTIVNITGGVIDEVQLVPCNNLLISDNFLMFPPGTFRYQLRGHDRNGVPFAFTSTVQINLQSPIANTTVVDNNNGLFLNSNTRTVSAQLQHNLIGNTLLIGVTGSDGLTLHSTTDKIIVPSGGIFTVTFTVSVPSILNIGSIAFINITVQDSCSTTTQTITLSAVIRAAPPIQLPPTVLISDGSCSSEEGEPYRQEINEKVKMILMGKSSQEGG